MATLADEKDYFTDHTVLRDPYSFFAKLYALTPVYHSPIHDLVYVTGFEESLAVLRNTDDFSSVISVGGPVIALPFTPQRGDISDQIEAFRSQFPASNMLVTYDGLPHTASRSILNRLFTPSRLRANEAYMIQLADDMVARLVARGSCDVIGDIATSYATLVVADLLGVPSDDRVLFERAIAAGPPAGDLDKADSQDPSAALEYMAGFFFGYITDRRANPREDVLTELAQATYPDGSTPDVAEIVQLAMFLFAAGQDTSAKLLGNGMRFLVEDKALQASLRAQPDLIPAFIEEALRLEGSTKATFRLAKRNTRIGDLNITAGQKVVVLLAAANRDPRRWDDPTVFRLDRPRIKEHLAFGRGAHTCVGAPLARVEVRAMLASLLAQTSDISLSETHHGPAGARHLDYEPSYIIRGLDALHLQLAAA